MLQKTMGRVPTETKQLNVGNVIRYNVAEYLWMIVTTVSRDDMAVGGITTGWLDQYLVSPDSRKRERPHNIIVYAAKNTRILFDVVSQVCGLTLEWLLILSAIVGSYYANSS